MNTYLHDHINRHLYPLAPEPNSPDGLLKYKNANGWTDVYIGQYMLFSERSTEYSLNDFPERFHAHDFYEVDIYCDGNVRYVSDHLEIDPKRDDILIFPPRCNHTAKLIRNSTYARIVFYFSPLFFTSIDPGLLPKLFLDGGVHCRSVRPEYRASYFYLLESLKEAVHSSAPDAGLLAYTYLLQLLNLIANHTGSNSRRVIAIPEKILNIKTLIDEQFASIDTIDDIANRLFYSREYVSRVFKQYYNINISEYLRNRRLDHSAALLENGYSTGYACDTSGFRSMSAFVSAFRERYGMTPTQFRHLKEK